MAQDPRTLHKHPPSRSHPRVPDKPGHHPRLRANPILGSPIYGGPTFPAIAGPPPPGIVPGAAMHLNPSQFGTQPINSGTPDPGNYTGMLATAAVAGNGGAGGAPGVSAGSIAAGGTQ